MPKPGNVERSIGLALALIAPVGGTLMAVATKHPEFIIYGTSLELSGIGMVARGTRINTEHGERLRRLTDSRSQQNQPK